MFYGGSAGGLTGGALANMAPELFFLNVIISAFCRYNDHNVKRKTTFDSIGMGTVG